MLITTRMTYNFFFKYNVDFKILLILFFKSTILVLIVMFFNDLIFLISISENA